MKKIYIHIGYPKTATTTLQKHFFPNLNNVDYLGKLYKENSDFFKLDRKIINAVLFQNELTFRIKLDEYRNVINHVIKSDKTLISEEAIIGFGLNPFRQRDIFFIRPCPLSIARKLRLLFEEKKYDLKIIITIRRQDEMITSKYAQSYRHFYSHFSQTSNFERFYKLFVEQKTNLFKNLLDYYLIDSVYSEIFGEENISILVYEDLQNHPDIFYNTIRKILKTDSPFDKKILNKEENKRTTKQKYKKCKPMNIYDAINFTKQKYFSDGAINCNDKIKEFLKKINLPFNTINKTIYLNEVQTKQLLNQYLDSNKKLSEKYGLDLSQYGYF